MPNETLLLNYKLVILLYIYDQYVCINAVSSIFRKSGGKSRSYSHLCFCLELVISQNAVYHLKLKHCLLVYCSCFGEHVHSKQLLHGNIHQTPMDALHGLLNCEICGLDRCNALVHVIYSRVSGQRSRAIGGR